MRSQVHDLNFHFKDIGKELLKQEKDKEITKDQKSVIL